ncbi:MAG: 4Fe-4S binding protein [Eggerthellaceae bacterium]|nr:4Fe-4S binding protein [Eggerthellaceae bacterium]MCH4221739.1 4Fe-4S binding protein [Eggerthellaceae bacterium]
MNRFIAIEPSRCVACGTCRAACSAGHKEAGLQDEPRLALFESRDVVASLTCHHCEGAPCFKVCPVNAIRHDLDGCVRVDEKKCIGCKLCAVSCPFGAIHMSGTPVAGVAGIQYNTPTFSASLSPILQYEVGVYPCAVKCDLCAYDGCHPHCVDACITNALHLVEEDGDSGTPREIEDKRAKALQSSVVMFDNCNDEKEGGERS